MNSAQNSTQSQRECGQLFTPNRLLQILAGALLLCCLFAPRAGAAENELEFELLKTFDSADGGATKFSTPKGVAVDPNLNSLYVLDGRAEALFKFDLNGVPVPFGGAAANISGNKLSLPLETEGINTDVAVNPATHTIYVSARSTLADSNIAPTAVLAFAQSGEPVAFAAGNGAGTNEFSTEPDRFEGIAVDQFGTIYLSHIGYKDSEGKLVKKNHVSAFAASGAEIQNELRRSSGFLVPGGESIGVAPNGDLYVVSVFADGPWIYSPTEFPLTPSTTFLDERTIGKSGVRAVALDSETENSYVASGSNVDVFDENLVKVGSLGAPGAGELPNVKGIAVDPETEKVYVAYLPPTGPPQVKIFQPKRCICPPSVGSTRVSQVTADSAELRAGVNPNTFDTTYWFEYGTADCELGPCVKVPLAGASIPAGFRAVTVKRSLTGLQADTTYHFRVVAENQLGTTEGPGKTFTTQISGLGFQLPDERVWEMVSPADKHGGSVTLPAQGIIQAADDGNGLAYLALGSIEADPEGNRALELSSVLARRDGDAWSSKDITPPHTGLTRPRDAEFKLMSPDLSRALFEARDDAPLSPLTTERTPYLRENSEPPTYTPLLTGAEGSANVAPGTVFGDLTGREYPIDVMGANPELTTVAFSSAIPLLEGAQPGLYAWRDGVVHFVGGGDLGSGQGSTRNAVSADGSRIFSGPTYRESGISTGGLYLFDLDLEKSIRLDLLQENVEGIGPELPAFQIASEDGTVVFFTDSHHLTKDASKKGRDLYRCEIPAGQSADGCASLIDISAPRKGSGEAAFVKDQALAASEDGSRIYFVAEGVLDTEANAQGDTALAEEPNLYLWEQGQGVRFIATLSRSDSPDWGAPGPQKLGYGGYIPADASPSGRYLAFMSERSLTGYDNEIAAGEPVQEAFRYDAPSGELTCVSCNPTAGRPQAMIAESNSMIDPAETWKGQLLAAALPEARTEDLGDSLYRPRTVLDNGRVFFNAFDSLVPADSNGTWDVYQYESTGVGDCSVESGDAATARSGEGCVSLISSGTAEEEAAFLETSLSGDDVFFLSTAKLSALDEDAVYDVYDARVDGVAARLPDLSECQGEACQPTVSAPDDPTPASAGFRGSGNLDEPPAKPCPKGKEKVRRKGKTRCVPRKKPPAKHRHRADRHRRPSR